jgi:hypothetical protein
MGEYGTLKVGEFYRVHGVVYDHKYDHNILEVVAIRNPKPALLTDDPKIRSFAESLADIAQMAGAKKFYSGDSREDIDLFITWAEEFEAIHANTNWEEIEYMDEIENFAMGKINDYNKNSIDF